VIKIAVLIQGIPRRAIQARKRCTAWFKSKGEGDEESNASHEHFIKTLEKAFDTFEPCFERTKSKPKNNSKATDDFVFNDLSILAIESIVVGPKSSKSSSKVSSFSSQVETTVYGLEHDPKTDLQLVIFCFFEDLETIGVFLWDTWQKVISGELDRFTASLTTNIAIQLVRGAEKDILAMYPEMVVFDPYLGWHLSCTRVIDQASQKCLHLHWILLSSQISTYIFSNTIRDPWQKESSHR
jgi:hypothetical protein